MFDKALFNAALDQYKQRFFQIWPNEKYKWEAIKWFQANWDIHAFDFPGMLKRVISPSHTYNLLASAGNYPGRMIVELAEEVPERVRAMYLNLFDESKDLWSRIDSFKQEAELIRAEFSPQKHSHYQTENVIMTYLWLCYPDRYYIYKFDIARVVSQKLKSEYTFERGAFSSNISNFTQFYDEISEALRNDSELNQMLTSKLTEACYPDPKLHTLTIDFCYFIARYMDSQKEWWPGDYNPGFSVEKWVELLHNSKVFTPNSLEIMKRFLDFGGTAACSQLAAKYGEAHSFYSSGSVALARRIVEFTNCPVITGDSDNSKWWPVLYTGRYAGKNDKGTYIWKLRDELKEALQHIDLSDVSLYARSAEPMFWKISHGPGSISDSEDLTLADNHLIAMDRYTNAKGTGKISQGDDFISRMRKGDFFYLCRGNSIRLLGKINSDEVRTLENGRIERSYTPIAKSANTAPYTGKHKWWTPNDNSTFISVPENQVKLFEDLILMPYFNKTIQDLLESTPPARNFWFLNANPKIWSMSSMPVGQVQNYTLYNENKNKRRIFQNFLDAKAGDIVLGYESTPVKQIVAILKVSEAQDGQNIYFEKIEGLSVPIDYAALKDCSELSQMEYFSMNQGSLFKLTKEEFEVIMDMIREENTSPVSDKKVPYSKNDFLHEVYMTSDKYDRLKAVLLKKKNIILQGAPGVGKTFAAKRLAYSIMGEKDDDRIAFVQFHQNYSYEDFMMGYKPADNGFELKYGIFYQFCQKAANHPDQDYFFIIDEINRGNLSKIFGELLMLIEADYRDHTATLAYNGLPFSVPNRLHIIGMMNTADRSLAMIDYALRRRFSFIEMVPGFDSEGFLNYQKSLNNDTFNALISCIKDLNQYIMQDKSLGKGFCIGHSYFCGADECTEAWMRDIVDFDIMPMLNEYWFDDESKVQCWENVLHGVFQ